jgi:glycosyltransferase involved in cell wall biosynthesis
MTDKLMFSVVTPTWNRRDGRLERCILSVADQETDGFGYEHIIVDDGSVDGTAEFIKDRCADWDWLRLVEIEHQGRVIARNEGMRAAKGEWLCWLDSDDAYDPMYLVTFARWIRKRPDVDLWVTGVVVHGLYKGPNCEGYGGHGVPKYTKLRRPWVPPLDKSGEHVHTLFNSGHVGTGMFVFRKRCLEKTGYLPPWANHNETADGIDEYLELEPGTTGYGSAGPKGGRPKGLIGNPHGDDHALFQALCLHFEARILADPDRRDPPCLYVHYMR